MEKKNFTITQLQLCLWTDIAREMEDLSLLALNQPEQH